MQRPSMSVTAIVLVIGLLLFFYLRSKWGPNSSELLFGDAGRARPTPYVFSPKQIMIVPLNDAPIVDGNLDDVSWRDATQITDFVTIPTLDPPSHRTELLAGHHGAVLYFGFRCHEAEDDGDRPANHSSAVNKKDAEDSLALYFSPTNDHTRFLRVHIDSQGHTRLFSGYLLRGELPIDRRVEENEWKRGTSLACAVSRGTSQWSGEIAVPLSALDVQGPLSGQVWGFDVVRRSKRPCPDVAWSGVIGQIDVAPMEFGEIFFDERSVAVSKIDFGQPFWGDNTAEVTITNLAPESVSLRLRSSVYLPIDEATLDQHEISFVLPHKEGQKVKVPYALSWRGRWPIHAEYCQRIFITVEQADTGRPIYSTSFPVGYDIGVIANERYGLDPDAPNPSPDDPDFIAKKRAYVIGRIPEFRRVGRGPEDSMQLVLAAVDGSIEFDLMKEGAVQRMANWLYSRFDTDVDRMLGAMFFVHQRSVTRHSRIRKALNPLSVIRSGGGLDDDRAWALAGILSRMKRDQTGPTYRCHCLSTSGHVVCGIEAVPNPKDVGDHFVFDPDVGVFYFTRDNTRLATLSELRIDRELSSRMHFNNVRHSREFYFQNDKISAYDGEERRVWPDGAPAE